MDTDTRELCIKRLNFFIERLPLLELKMLAAFASGVYREMCNGR